jgi:hypothetical protein
MMRSDGSKRRVMERVVDDVLCSEKTAMVQWGEDGPVDDYTASSSHDSGQSARAARLTARRQE